MTIADSNRVQGEYFSIARERLNAIEALAVRAGVEGESISENLIGYDWANADDHQRWIDTAPLAEIVDWLAVVFTGSEG